MKTQLLPGQSVQMLHNNFCEQNFHNTRSKHPLMQVDVISSHNSLSPVTDSQLDLPPFTTMAWPSRPENSTPVQAMSGQLLQENSVSKALLTPSKKHPHSLLHKISHPVAEDDQVGQAGPDFLKPLLAGPHHLLVLHMLHDGTEVDCHLKMSAATAK